MSSGRFPVSMIGPRRSDSDSIVDRMAVRLSAATLALATGWVVIARLVPHFIRNGYRGESVAWLNHMINGQPGYPLEEYLARWNVLTWSGLGAVLSAGAFLIVATRSRPRWLVRLGPPVCAFLLARSLLWFSFAAAPVQQVPSHHRWDGTPAKLATSFSSDAWSRWDSHVYLSIARFGYEFYPCDIPLEGAPIAREGGRGTTGWCGNCPWFPGYSALIWSLARLGVTELLAGVLVSATFCLLTLFLLWTRFLSAEPSVKSLLCLVLASWFPGAVYYHAVYPVSMVVFFLLLSLYFIRRKQWKLCGLASALAALAYPPGAFFALVFAAWMFCFHRGVRWRDKLWPTFTVGAMTTAGVALVFVVQRLFVGAWGTFFLAQNAYKTHGLYVPVAALIDAFKLLIQIDWAHPSKAILAANTLSVAAIAVLLVVFGVRLARQSLGDASLVVFLLVFWLLFLLLGEDSLTRKQALLLPAVPLARSLPEWLLAGILATALVFVLLMGMMYFNASLV